MSENNNSKKNNKKNNGKNNENNNKNQFYFFNKWLKNKLPFCEKYGRKEKFLPYFLIYLRKIFFYK